MNECENIKRLNFGKKFKGDMKFKKKQESKIKYYIASWCLRGKLYKDFFLSFLLKYKIWMTSTMGSQIRIFDFFQNF